MLCGSKLAEGLSRTDETVPNSKAGKQKYHFAVNMFSDACQIFHGLGDG